jgi:sec-independent protein translocase protein TatB
VPAATVPGPAGPPPVATAENVPGLEAALAEPGAPAEPAAALAGSGAADDAPTAAPRAAPGLTSDPATDAAAAESAALSTDRSA